MYLNVYELIACVRDSRVLDALTHLGYAIKVQPLANFYIAMNSNSYDIVCEKLSKCSDMIMVSKKIVDAISNPNYRKFLREKNICHIAIKKIEAIDIVKLYTLLNLNAVSIQDEVLTVLINYISNETNFFKSRKEITDVFPKIANHLKKFNIICSSVVIKFIDNNEIIDESHYFDDGRPITTSADDVNEALIKLDEVANQYINIDLANLINPTPELKMKTLARIDYENKCYNDFLNDISSLLSKSSSSKDLRDILLRIDRKISYYEKEIYNLSIPPF